MKNKLWFIRQDQYLTYHFATKCWEELVKLRRSEKEAAYELSSVQFV